MVLLLIGSLERLGLERFGLERFGLEVHRLEKLVSGFTIYKVLV